MPNYSPEQLSNRTIISLFLSGATEYMWHGYCISLAVLFLLNMLMWLSK